MIIKPLNDEGFIREMGCLASSMGLRVYAVGGCVRDWAIGTVSSDMDFLCSSDPEPLAAALSKKYGGSLTSFKKFLTVRLFLSGAKRVDFAVFRKETYESPAALPVVSRADSVQEDLRRRDFAFNAMAMSVMEDDQGAVTDPYGGAKDISSGLVRALHEKSFVDDPTRIYRAARFAGRFGWELEDKTIGFVKAAVKDGVPGLLSRERLRNELLKILSERDPFPALEILSGLGAIGYLGPGLRYDNRLSVPASAEARLGLLAFLSGDSAAGFISAMKLTRKLSREIMSGLGLGGRDKSLESGALASEIKKLIRL